MVDIESHRIIDMIGSREYEDVKNWLQKYPNIMQAARDGSLIYHNAIAAAHPKAIQISDRFHLLKNLTEYAQEYLKKEIKTYVKIPAAQNISKVTTKSIAKADENRKLTLKEKYRRIEELTAMGYCKSAICKALNMDIRTYIRLMSFSDMEVKSLNMTKRMLIHEEKAHQKSERMKEVRRLAKKGISKSEICRRLGLNIRTVARYLDKRFNPSHASYGSQRNGVLTPFMKEIDFMLEQGAMGIRIEEKIRNKGYKGSSSNIRNYISAWKCRCKPISNNSGLNSGFVENIQRKDIFKLLYHKPEKVKIITKEQLEAINYLYPCFTKVHDIVWDFKTILGSKEAGRLESWVEKALLLNIPEINSFTEGLTRDWDAVINAVVSPYSNGLAEGSVNKLKLIKRIMYGRCSFETLRIKTLRLEQSRFN